MTFACDPTTSGSGAAVMEELVEKIEEIRAVAAGSNATDERVD